MKKLPISPVFVPANKLDLIEKIIKSDADGMIIDLEDSVPLAEKDTSRDNLYEFLSHNIINKTVLVRINPTGGDTYEIVLEIDREMMTYLLSVARQA